ncbi:MAG: hypothetical protein QXT53_02900 [Ignisphaera sp.]
MSQNVSDVNLLAEFVPYQNVAEIRQKVEELRRNMDGLNIVAQQVKNFAYVGNLIGRWKMLTCKMNTNGVCMGWRMPKEVADEVKKNLGEGVIVERDGVSRFNVSSALYVCALCPIYSPRT